MTALMECMRFSASSNTRERADSNTASVTSSSGQAELLGRRRAPMVVLRSWKAGRQCMKMASSAALSMSLAFTW